jgi:hypothetical protein
MNSPMKNSDQFKPSSIETNSRDGDEITRLLGQLHVSMVSESNEMELDALIDEMKGWKVQNSLSGNNEKKIDLTFIDDLTENSS